MKLINITMLAVLFSAVLLLDAATAKAQISDELKSQIEKEKQLQAKVKTGHPAWKTAGSIGITFNQYYFSNWAKGGNNSLAANGILNYDLDYHSLDSSYIWSNNINLGYGSIYISELGTRKADDRCEISSKYGFRAVENLYYTALLSFKSQFFKGYNYPNDSVVVSNFLAPAYIVASLGINYKPFSFLSVYISPLTGKYIIVNDQQLANQGAYGVKPAVYDSETGNMITPGEKTMFNFGAYFTASFDYDIIENVNFKSKLELFNNYTSTVARDRDKIIINSSSALAMRVNSFMSANLFLDLVYDYQNLVPLFETLDGVQSEVGRVPRLQVRENFGLGFSFNF